LTRLQPSESSLDVSVLNLLTAAVLFQEDLTRLQPSESSLDVSVLNHLERFSTASQTDLSGEVSSIWFMH
jgi:hypothetical protein